MTYEEVKNDYKKLLQLHGSTDTNDVCGGFCNTEEFFWLLERPTKSQAKSVYKKLIQYAFERGFEHGSDKENPDLLDHEVYDLARRYGCL